ncbi:MAG: lysophospholipid acyltransferase family protein [Anaerolineae bacterium]|nr:lysophospholipid acyltransferase family protein [Anaerolineae bacterium]
MVTSAKLYQASTPFQKFIRFAVFNLVRFFYPHLEIRGRDNLPADGPVMFVLNHPNGLMDPILLMIGVERSVSFLAMSLLFANPIGKTLCAAFGALPVFRRKDDGKPGGPRGDAAERNEVTFARCRQLLHQGGALALFPEGITHSEPQLAELRTGAARIALSTEAEANWQANLKIVPVGLWYEDKTTFRTSVLLVIGEPFTLSRWAEDYTLDEYETVRAVTAQIEEGLDAVVLQAENTELLSAVPILAEWTAPHGDPATLTEQHTWAANLLATYAYLHKNDPTRLEQIADQAWGYASVLQSLGVEDPWSLELPDINHWWLLRATGQLLVGFPFALAGAALSYGPYRLARPAAMVLTGHDATQISTFKLIGGALFVLIGWIIEAVLVGWWVDWGWGVLLFIAAPFLGYVALRWSELWRAWREVVSTWMVRWRRRHLVEALIARRQSLTKAVQAAVETWQLAGMPRVEGDRQLEKM